MSRTFPYIPPDRPTIAIVGEAPGFEESLKGQPFVGQSGKELTRMLQTAEINRLNCYITNVFWDRPPENSVDNWCVSARELDDSYPYRYVRKGYYLKREYLEYKYRKTEEEDRKFISKLAERFHREQPGEMVSILDRLALELSTVRPNVVIALGNTACWALLNTDGIGKIRGTALESTLVPGMKVLPTYHPAAVLRNWNQRPIVLADLIKAANESQFPEIRRPKRQIWIEPTLEDLESFWAQYLQDAPYIACDIETKANQITCIGFAPSEDLAIVVPFFGETRGSYWPTSAEEVLAWRWVQRVLQSPAAKIFHNGLYDMQYIWRAGIPIRNASEDTMILHHALQPELLKSLGFLGSIYTAESDWKRLRGGESGKLEE